MVNFLTQIFFHPPVPVSQNLEVKLDTILRKFLLLLTVIKIKRNRTVYQLIDLPSKRGREITTTGCNHVKVNAARRFYQVLGGELLMYFFLLFT